MAGNGGGRHLPGETALIVTVPAAEPLVGPWRSRFDAAAVAGGVPAHVTLLYPFLDGGLLDDDVLRELAEVFARHRAFEARLARCGRFPGVLYLAPEPAAPFRALTEAVTARWPEAPPYGGAFAEVIPHLSVAKDQPADVFAAAEAELSPRLPVAARISAVQLIALAGCRWQQQRTFPLAGH